MIYKKLKISSEFSAQGRNHSKSPGLTRLIKKSTILSKIGDQNCVVDYGCGKLRHFDLIKVYANELYLVDTKEQLERIHTERGEIFSFNDYVENNSNGTKCHILDNIEFEKIVIKCDIIFSIAVADVLPLEIYSNIIKDSYNKLKKGKYFILVVPRNDTSIMRRCNEKNSYKKGNVFRKGKYFTYMRNYRDQKPLYNEFVKTGFSLIEDFSIYSQLCAIFVKN